MQAKISFSVSILLVVAALAISACSRALPTALASASPSSTNEVLTVPAVTLTIAPTFTAGKQGRPTTTPFPSITPIPSFTPYISPTAGPSATPLSELTPTPTFPYGWTAVPPDNATPGDYICRLISKLPDNWSQIRRGTSFKAIWNVQNIGPSDWQPGAVVLNFIEGNKMQADLSTYALPGVVHPGKAIRFSVDMVAPKQADTYISSWGLMLTNKTQLVFCPLVVRIIVY